MCVWGGGSQIRLGCGCVCGEFSGLLAGAGGTKSVDGGIITSQSSFSLCELNGCVGVVRQLGESAIGWEAYKQQKGATVLGEEGCKFKAKTMAGLGSCGSRFLV